MSAPVGSLKDLQDLLEGRFTNVYGDPRPFDFYSVLMYTPMNGLNESLHKYMVGGDIGGPGEVRHFRDHFEIFNSLTGPHWLVAVVEDICRGHEIKEFKPAEVYNIARYLGARVDAIPAIVFFTEPREHKKTLVLGLREILPTPKDLNEEDLTLLFQKLAAMIEELCRKSSAGEARLEALARAIEKEWPKKSNWGDRAITAATWSVANGKNIIDAISGIVKLVHPYMAG